MAGILFSFHKTIRDRSAEKVKTKNFTNKLDAQVQVSTAPPVLSA
jgi:hypothetical protein